MLDYVELALQLRDGLEAGLEAVREAAKLAKVPIRALPKEHLAKRLAEHHEQQRKWSQRIEERALNIDLVRVYCEPTLRLLEGVTAVPSTRRLRLADVSAECEVTGSHARLTADLGFGKTTAVRRWFAHALQQYEKEPRRTLPPVVVRLGELGEGHGLLAEAAAILGIAEYFGDGVAGTWQSEFYRISIIDFLARQPLFLFLDGLDEAPPSMVDGIVGEVNVMASKCPLMRVVLTYRSGLRIPAQKAFKTYEILPFGPEAMNEYARKRLGDRDGRMFSARVRHEPYFELVSSPLVLHMCCAHFERRGDLPSSVSAMIREIADVHLSAWDDQGGVGRRSVEWKNVEISRLLRHLAFLTADIDDFTFDHLVLAVRATHPAREFDPAREESLGDYLRNSTGLLIQSRPGYLRFRHSLLRDYFLAEYLLRNELPSGPGFFDRHVNALVMSIAQADRAHDMLARVVLGPMQTLRDFRSLEEFLRGLRVNAVEFSDDPAFGLALLSMAALLDSPTSVPGDRIGCHNALLPLLATRAAELALERAWPMFEHPESLPDLVDLKLRTDLPHATPTTPIVTRRVRISRAFYLENRGHRFTSSRGSTPPTRGDATGSVQRWPQWRSSSERPG